MWIIVKKLNYYLLILSHGKKISYHHTTELGFTITKFEIVPNHHTDSSISQPFKWIPTEASLLSHTYTKKLF